MKFTKDNILKIKQGRKTATSRTYRIPDGESKIDDELTIFIKGYYYSNIFQMKNYQSWAIEEGFESWQDMYENCVFKHTKDFMDGYISMWIYKITKL